MTRLALFHGTRAASEILKRGFRPSASGEYGPGIYFARNPYTANFYAWHVARGPERPAVLKADIVVEQPFAVEKLDWIRLTERSTPRAVHRRLMRRGFDSIFATGLTSSDQQVVVFSAEQIVPGSIQKVSVT